MPVDTVISPNQASSLLENFFNQHVIEISPVIITNKEFLLRLFAALCGAIWGVPWTQPASLAATVFDEDLVREAFSKIFSMGIIAAVGADGLWLMLSIGKDFGSKSIYEKELTVGISQKHKVLKALLAAIFSFLSFAPVYASYKYGGNKYLALITFLGNYAYNFFGYRGLIEVIYNKFDIRNKSPECAQALKIRQGILTRIDHLVNSSAPIGSSAELSRSIFNDQNEVSSPRASGPTLKMLFQLLPTFFVSLSSTFIRVILTKEFVQKYLYDSIAFAYIFAIVSELPGFVITAMSSYHMFGRLYDLLGFLKRKIYPTNCSGYSLNSNEAYSPMTQAYPWTKIILLLLVFSIALTSPSAVAYIAYESLTADEFNPIIKWTAVTSMILALFIFSDFTLTELLEMFLETIYKNTHAGDDDIRKKLRLAEFGRVISNANLCFFQPSNSSNGGNASVEEEPDSGETSQLVRGSHSSLGRLGEAHF